MKRITAPDGSQIPNMFGTGKAGATNGDPVHGVIATQADSDSYNAIQEEIATAVEGFGFTLDASGADKMQLYKALGGPRQTGVPDPLAGGPLGRLLSEMAAANWRAGTSGVATDLNAVCCQPGVNSAFIAVENGGVILGSLDGLHWGSIVVSGATANNLRGVAANGTDVIAVGDNGTIVHNATPNNGAWTSPSLGGLSANFYAVAYGGGNWVAVGQNGMIYVSPDAVAWNSYGIGGAHSFRGVAYGVGVQYSLANPLPAPGGLWVAVDDNGDIYTSPDAHVWDLVPGTGGSTRLNGVAYSPAPAMLNSQALTGAVNGVNTVYTLAYAPSPVESLLITYTPPGGPAQLLRLGIDFTVALAVGSSHPSATLTMTSPPLTGSTLSASHMVSGFWVAVDAIGRPWFSADTQSWTIIGGAAQQLNAIGVDARGCLVAVGTASGGNFLTPILSSHDGSIWTSRVGALDPAVPHSGFTAVSLYGVAFGLGCWVIVGAGGALQASHRV